MIEFLHYHKHVPYMAKTLNKQQMKELIGHLDFLVQLSIKAKQFGQNLNLDKIFEEFQIDVEFQSNFIQERAKKDYNLIKSDIQDFLHSISYLSQQKEKHLHSSFL